MTERISQRELRNDSGRIMRGLAAGRSYVVTSRAEPVGELRPLRRRRFVAAQEVVEMFRGAPPIDAERLRADLDELAEQEPSHDR